MRKIQYIFPLLLAILVASCGRKTTKADGSPKVSSIQLDSTSAWIGTFPKSDSRRTTVFTFTNVGDAPLEFLDHDVSCGCVSASFPEKPIKPKMIKDYFFTEVWKGWTKKYNKYSRGYIILSAKI